MPYDHSTIEPRWQRYWDERQTFAVGEDLAKPKFYALDMFPYPSGKGLHVGHPAGYTVTDVVCRFKRARGFNVLHPMGFDAFGLPAEQKAIEEGVPPRLSTAEAIETFRRQLKRLGFSYDWSREVSTCDPRYYKWTQLIFALLWKRGLAFEADVLVNWCSALGTVLANDEVIDGRSERGGHPVVRVRMRQWMLRITAFADRLLSGLSTVDWLPHSKTAQREWIGRSQGARVRFHVQGSDDVIEVFTTRPDTIFGATFLVLAPEHALVDTVTGDGHRAAVDAYRQAIAGKSDLDRQIAEEKTGVDTGACATNPATGHAIPIWIADYVIGSYGTGAIMAVPGHDDRDWAFARAMALPIVEVITGGDVREAAYTGEGKMVNSGPFDGTPTADGTAIEAVTGWLEALGAGTHETTYRFHDWTFARQRYWGEPIPVLKDPQTGEVIRCLEADELPLMLPPVEQYEPLGTGQSPLTREADWLNVVDAVTGQSLVRETDTMPGSAGSSWYFLRYCDPHNDREFCAREKSDYWMPVDLYVGGPEHLTGHLLYARMWQKALRDEGLVRDEEPFQKLRHQGMVLAPAYYDSDGRVVPSSDVEERAGVFCRKGTDAVLTPRVEKMSKRLGNVVNPDEIIERYGGDAMRVYISFMGDLAGEKVWQTDGLEGQANWLRRVWRLYFDADDRSRVKEAEATAAELHILHKAIKKVTHDIESLDHNTAVSALHIATRALAQLGASSRQVLEPLIQLVAPFAPHLAEEVWESALGRTDGISYAPWPAWDAALATDEDVEIGVQVNGKTRGSIRLPRDAEEAVTVAAARLDPAVAKYP